MTPPNCIAAAAGTPLSAVSAASAATGVPARLEAQSRDGGFQGYSASGIVLHARDSGGQDGRLLEIDLEYADSPPRCFLPHGEWCSCGHLFGADGGGQGQGGEGARRQFHSLAPAHCFSNSVPAATASLINKFQSARRRGARHQHRNSAA